MLIQKREITHPDVMLLVRAAEDELLERYPDEPRTPLSPHANFVVAYVLAEPVGCGAFVHVGPGVGEIKRMYVQPAHRRAGVGRRILAALERRAAASRYVSLILETGVHQPEALALYESLGYSRTDRYGSYVDNPDSVCFAKDLNGLM